MAFGNCDWDDPQARFDALHHQSVSAKCVTMGHQIDPQNKIGCMIAGNACYPHTCNPADVLAAQKQQREMNFYCGDVQVRGAHPFVGAQRVAPRRRARGGFARGRRHAGRR